MMDVVHDGLCLLECKPNIQTLFALLSEQEDEYLVRSYQIRPSVLFLRVDGFATSPFAARYASVAKQRFPQIWRSAQ